MPRPSGKSGTGSLDSKAATVDVLLSLLRLATGPELGFRRFEVPDAVRPSRLKARLPEDNVRVSPFCLGVAGIFPIDVGGTLTDSGRVAGAIPIDVGGQLTGSGRVRGSTYDNGMWLDGSCDCEKDWFGTGEPCKDDQLGLGASDEVLWAEAGVKTKDWAKVVFTRCMDGMCLRTLLGRGDGAGEGSTVVWA